MSAVVTASEIRATMIVSGGTTVVALVTATGGGLVVTREIVEHGNGLRTLGRGSVLVVTWVATAMVGVVTTATVQPSSAAAALRSSLLMMALVMIALAAVMGWCTLLHSKVAERGGEAGHVLRGACTSATAARSADCVVGQGVNVKPAKVPK